MKKIYLLMIALIMVATTISCKKSTTDPPDPPVADKYSVTYKLDMTGDYTDFKLVYYETGSVKKEVTSVTFPWEESFDNYVVGDSIVMNFSYMTVLGKPTSYSYSADPLLNGVTMGVGGAGSATNVNPVPIKKISESVISYKIAN